MHKCMPVLKSCSSDSKIKMTRQIKNSFTTERFYSNAYIMGFIKDFWKTTVNRSRYDISSIWRLEKWQRQ